MTYKPVDTAITMVVGPCIDDTDFKSLEEAIAYNAAGMDVSLIVEKTDGTTAVTAITLTTGGTSDWTHKDGGYYEIEITAAQNVEEGVGYIRGICTGVLPFESAHYDIVKDNIYDSFIKGTDKLQIDLTQIGGVVQSLTDFKDMVDTGYDPSTHKIQSDLIYIHGSALTETAGQLAAGFTKLFDVATPLLLASDVMRGTDGANTTVPDAAGVAPSASEIKTAIEAAGSHLALILADTSTDGVLLAAAATSAQLVDDVWDEILSGATHNIAGSAGRRVREIGAYAIESGTAQAGSSNSITLAATASAIDGTYNRNLVILVDNTGVGQTRTIVDYNGTTKVAVIDRDWRTSPDATTTYQVTPDNTPLVVDQGVAQAGSATTITLRTYASSTNDIYLCNVVAIIAGTGRGQARLVGGYVGATKVVTICGDNWITTPDTTSVYVLMPYGTTCTSCIGTYALGLINTECDTALTDYDPPTRTEATSDKDAIITEVNANETKIDALQTDSTAIKAKTDNLPSGIGKNEALAKFDVFMVLSTNHVTGATGKTVTGTISKDGGAFAAITNTITEVSDGMYTIASGFTQTEMNADTVTLKFTADDCDTRIITIHTS